MVSYQSAKEEIKRAADIVELIGQFVQLKKAGQNYVGLCPFHSEKAPSFTVSPERQTFHCFGCKKGGDIFTFWMEYHSSTFPEAIKDLAERYHVTITARFSSSADQRKSAQRKLLFKLNEKATDYFQEALSSLEKGRSGKDYLAGRSISKEIISQFRLGYAPDEWDGLTGYLKRLNLDHKMAVQAGLIIPKKNGGYYDRFRGRIIFPIFDLRQQIVGFGGRVLGDALPKYLNTPETPIFHKGTFLYGLQSSFKAIKEKGRAVVVEGYMDFLALRVHGIQEVVATLGTALTADHVRKLKGYAKEAVVVFDSDEAGKAAALKSLPVFLDEGLFARALVLPDGHDPDSFVNENGQVRFLELLDQASPMFDFFLEQKLMQQDAGIEGKFRALKEIIPVLSGLRSDTQRSLYVRRLAEKTGVKEEVLWAETLKFRKTASAVIIERDLKQRLTGSGVEKRISDIQQLNLLVHYPHTTERLMDCESKILLSDPTVIEIVDTIFEKYHQERHVSLEKLQEGLNSEAARVLLREALSERSFYSEQEVEQAVTEIEQKAQQKKISASLASLKKAKGDAAALNQILKLKRAQGN